MQRAGHNDEKFTYADYANWPDGERWELIGGEPHAMSPAPGVRHQRLVLALAGSLRRAIGKRSCELFLAPLDVRLSSVDVVEPDLFVVCDPQQIKATHIDGAPKLVVEVVSPHSVHRDRLLKLRLYARHGVQEYWLVTPFPHTVEVLQLDGPSYRIHGVFAKEDCLTSAAFPELRLGLAAIFDFPLEPEEQALLDQELREPRPAWMTNCRPPE